MFYNVFAGAVSLHCYTLIKEISWSSALHKRSVFSFAQLSPSNKYFSSNTQIFFLFFPFESNLLRIVTETLGISGFCCKDQMNMHELFLLSFSFSLSYVD